MTTTNTIVHFFHNCRDFFHMQASAIMWSCPNQYRCLLNNA
jgi:hypothetical protein